MADPLAWLNGCEIQFSEMAVPVWDLGLVAGAAVSEMARTYGHRSFRLADHVARLLDSCSELQFPVEYNGEELVQAADRLVETNCGTLPDSHDLGIVWFVTAGANRTYLGGRSLPGPTVGVHTFPLPFHLWHDAAMDGVALRVPERIRAPTCSLPLHRKVRNRLHWLLADREVAETDPNSRALLTDEHGRLTETSTSAFYAVIDGAIVTPAENVLNSLSRRMVQEAASACDIRFQQTSLTLADVSRFSQAFLSSTPSGLLPVKSINGTVMQPCSVMEPLLNWWEQTTGVSPRNQILQRTSDSE